MKNEEFLAKFRTFKKSKNLKVHVCKMKMSWGVFSDIISNMLALCITLFFYILQPFFHLYQCVICFWIHIWAMTFYMHLNLINGCIGLHFKLCFFFSKVLYNLLFILPCGQEELGIEAPSLSWVDDPLSSISSPNIDNFSCYQSLEVMLPFHSKIRWHFYSFLYWEKNRKN